MIIGSEADWLRAVPWAIFVESIKTCSWFPCDTGVDLCQEKVIAVRTFMDGHKWRSLTCEDGEVRNPLAGLFNQCYTVKSFDQVLQGLIIMHPHLEKLRVLARKKAKKVRKFYNGEICNMSEDFKCAIVLYTIEDTPEEGSPYNLVNKSLRDKNRAAAKPWVDYIWLLCHALREVPPIPYEEGRAGCGCSWL
jgi:hypothetical protein